MTKQSTPDSIVNAVLDQFFKTLDESLSPKTEEKAPEPESVKLPEEDTENFGDVNPYEEAIRILAELEDEADEFDDELRLAIADRYIEIGRQINK